ncbi:NAD-dependent epimerase/dehydratase family protein [Kitasatospora sp. NPDC052868]|uniref:NAD-dependent epimerase/dehydratase family protein n=1 Tax=Kitasatospora sp. NPDC052868 TaxID=3364060 RepID=UPI0037CC6F92
MTTRVALTGSTGFIGAAALRALTDQGVRVRALVRTPQRDGGPVEWLVGDLTDADSSARLCEGADVLVHLASRVGGSEEECEAVNDRGTEALMGAAVRAGVGRIVHLSTAAVYGAGPHRGIAVDGVPAVPVSAASRTRLAGERHAREAGAVVLRPGLVTGAGDRWVVPALEELVRRVPVLWDGGQGRLSMVDVGDLARLVAALATAAEAVAPGVHHASHPEPVRVGDLLTALAGYGVLPALPGPGLPWAECLRLLDEHPGRISERQFALVGQDHWYRSEEIWRLAQCPPGPGPLARLADAADWYRRRSAQD